MLKNVLIATDGSPNAEKAVSTGADIAAKYGAEVILLHVLLRDHLSDAMRHLAETEYHAADMPMSVAISKIPDSRFPLAQMLPKDAASPDQALRAVSDHILGKAESIAEKHGITKPAKMSVDGRPAARILEIAEETGVDMIVVGAQGLTNLKTLLLGSVSDRVSNGANVTCLIVH